MFCDLGKSDPTVAERQRPQSDAVSGQQVEGDVRRTVMAKEEFVEAGVVELEEFAVEHETWEPEIEHLLAALHAVAVAGDELAADGVGCGAEAVELDLEEPVRMVERLSLRSLKAKSCMIASRARIAACTHQAARREGWRIGWHSSVESESGDIETADGEAQAERKVMPDQR